MHRTAAVSPRLLILFLVLALGLAPAVAVADGDPPPERDVDGLEDLLPRRETLREREAWFGREDLMPRRGTAADPPPAAPVRNVAEWEPATGVLIRYPLGLPYALLRDLDDVVTLHVVVSSSSQTAAQSNLTANGVDMGRVQFLVRPNDSIWTRDYGPWYVFDGAGQLAIVDHTYNRPYRPNDDLIPIYFAQQQALPVHSHDMYHTGGNYMTDGAHVGSSTRLVYDEAAAYNDLDEAGVDQLMADYYGLEQYTVVTDIESGGIHHIDTWAKFLDEETVLVKQVWPAHHTYAALEQRATLLASLVASTGRNYRVHRVVCQDIGGGSPASYTNSLLLNRRIYVPLFGNAAGDTAALQAYRTAAPGHDVRGFAYSGFLTDDALHCRTMGVFDRGMLRVEHTPPLDEVVGPADLRVLVEAHSGEALTSVDLVYRQTGGDWIVVPMSDEGAGIHSGLIPAPIADTDVEYYVQAADASGRTASSPRAAPVVRHELRLLAPATAAGDAPTSPVLVPAPWPNPFNPTVSFRFELRDAAPVRLSVMDARGRLVRRLLDGGMQPAGPAELVWDGRDDAGRPASSGVYTFVLEAAGLHYRRGVTLVR
ncbi:MAG: agmatine deiminase family protein [bacterium]|nr:agmatine deiminase family protein [bacterium]